jgi:hypothetical protein
VSAFLFSRNFPLILEKGIELTALLESNVFLYHFDLDEWPSTHTNDQRIIRPYNNSLFNLRQHYLTTFPEESFARMPDADSGGVKIDSSKIYKIEYSINLLPHVCSYISTVQDINGRSSKLKVNEGVDVIDLLN